MEQHAIDQDLYERIEPVLRQAVMVQTYVIEQGSEIREHSKRAYNQLLDAHLLAMGALGHAVMRQVDKAGKADTSIDQRFNLFASFAQGVPFCELAISEGLYVQAATLLKQEMETVAAIEECQLDRRIDGKTPNVKNTLWNIARSYGDLNRAAHVADSQVLHHCFQIKGSSGNIGASLVPVFNAETARSLYALHVALIVLASIELNELYEEAYGTGLTLEEMSCAIGAVRLLSAEGFLEAPDGALDLFYNQIIT